MLPLLVFSAMGGGSAFAQAMAFSYDLNTPSYDEPRNSGQGEFTTDSGLTLGWGIYSRPVCSDCAATRIGLVIGYQAMTVKYDGIDYSGVEYQAVNVQAAVDHRLYGAPRLNLTIGVALGPSFINTSNPESFFGFPETALLVSPNLKVVLPVFEKASATIEARGAFLTGDRETTFPFESGGILAVGIEVHSGPKVKGG